MAAKQNSTTGMVRTEDVAKILPVTPLVSSRAGWNTIFLAYYQQPACEIPKHYLSQHTLTICGELSTPALIECCLDDRLKRYWFDVETLSFVNIQSAMEAVGGSLKDIVSLRIYMVDYKPDEEINVIVNSLKEFFPDGNPPATTWIGISSLAVKDYLIEIEATAVLE